MTTDDTALTPDGATETTAAPDPAQDTTDGAEAVSDAHTQPDEGDDRPASREKRLRNRAQDAETARDAALAQLDALRRQIAEEASGLLRPAAMWRAGIDAAALFDADGRLDRAALTEAVTRASDELGLARANPYPPNTPRPDPSQGMSSRDDDRPGMAAALTPRGQR